MKNNIAHHPSLCFARELASICRPLNELSINYFSHVRLDKNKQFAAINNHPDFMEHYLRNNYFNIGIHMVDPNKLGHYIVVDEIESKGLSAKMHEEAAERGIKHFFTIVDKRKPDYDQFYHFASDARDKSFNQNYLAHLDLLKLFIEYFNETIKQSKTLCNVYDMKFNIDPDAEGFTIKEDQSLHHLYQKRLEFLDGLKHENASDNLTQKKRLRIDT